MNSPLYFEYVPDGTKYTIKATVVSRAASPKAEYNMAQKGVPYVARCALSHDLAQARPRRAAAGRTRLGLFRRHSPAFAPGGSGRAGGRAHSGGRLYWLRLLSSRD